jgi:hypothetical protein
VVSPIWIANVLGAHGVSAAPVQTSIVYVPGSSVMRTLPPGRHSAPWNRQRPRQSSVSVPWVRLAISRRVSWPAVMMASAPSTSRAVRRCRCHQVAVPVGGGAGGSVGGVRHARTPSTTAAIASASAPTSSPLDARARSWSHGSVEPDAKKLRSVVKRWRAASLGPCASCISRPLANTSVDSASRPFLPRPSTNRTSRTSAIANARSLPPNAEARRHAQVPSARAQRSSVSFVPAPTSMIATSTQPSTGSHTTLRVISAWAVSRIACRIWRGWPAPGQVSRERARRSRWSRRARAHVRSCPVRRASPQRTIAFVSRGYRLPPPDQPPFGVSCVACCRAVAAVR